jgi:hypothetical protein
MEQNLQTEEPTLEQEMVAEYLERTRKMMEGDDTVKVGDMLFGPKRLEDETREEYKQRQKMEKLITKHYSRGVRFAKDI